MASGDFVSALLRLMADHSDAGSYSQPPVAYKQATPDGVDTRRGSAAMSANTAASASRMSEKAFSGSPPVSTDRPLSPEMKRRQLAFRKYVKGIKKGKAKPRGGRIY